MLTLISVSLPPCVIVAAARTNPGHSGYERESWGHLSDEGGKLQLIHMHPTFVASNKVALKTSLLVVGL